MNDSVNLNLSVIRTWGFNDGSGYMPFQSAAGVYNEATFVAFDRVIKEASDKGIKLIVPLVNSWDDFGGMCQYVRWCNITNSNLCDADEAWPFTNAVIHDSFYTNSCTKQLYKNYVNYFLNRTNTLTGIKYKDDPTIFAWELANEPRCRSDTSTATLNNWIGEMSNYIESLDNKHMITAGGDGGYKNKGGDIYNWWYYGWEGQDFIGNHQWANIDFATFRYYPESGKFTGVDVSNWIPEHAQDARDILNKPLIMEEFGSVNNKTPDFIKFYNLLEANNVSGDTFWLLADHLKPGNDGYFISCPEDMTICAVINSHGNYMKNKTGTTASQTNQTNESLFEEMFRVHMNYFLSNLSVTSYGLPLTAYKVGDRARYGYSNPTEWGYLLQAYIAASERGIINQSDAIKRINRSLNTMIYLQQNSSQNYNKLFYPYYTITNGAGTDILPAHDSNINIPSIDNGLLYASLLITEGWAKKKGNIDIENKSKTIKNKMNFSIFFFTSGSDRYMAHTIDANTNLLSSSKWDVYADEGGLMSIIAYVSGSVDFNTFQGLINSQMRGSASWNGFTVKEAQWFNSMFAWSVRSLAGFKVIGTNYSRDSFVPTTKAHLAYGNFINITYPGFSDAMTQPGGVGRYTPPNLAGQVPSDIPPAIMPHAFFVPFNVITDLDNATINNLTKKISLLKNDSAGYYHNSGAYPFGFEVVASPYSNNLSFSGLAGRNIFETLSEAYTVLSLFNFMQKTNNSNDFYDIAKNVSGYETKVNEILNFLYNSTAANVSSCTVPIDGMNLTKNTILCRGVYNLPNGITLRSNSITLDCNGSTIIGNGASNGIGVYTSNNLNYLYQNTVKNCIIKGFYKGIFNYNGWDHIYTNNTFINNSRGVWLESSHNDLVSGNNFSGNVFSILLYWYNYLEIIDSNIIKDGDHGVYLDYGSYNNIIKNNILANNSRGIESYGPFDRPTSRNNYTDNTMINNAYGMYLNQYSRDNLIISNDLINNSNGVYIDGSNNTVSENRFIDNNVQAYDTFQRNFWNRTYVGNYWSDFSSNSGYPYNYTLPGSGYSVDYWPVGKAVNCTIPYGGMVITQNTTFCPGTYKINGTIIVGYGITLGCKDTVLLGDRSFAGLDTSSMSTIKNCKLINFSSGYSGMHRSLNSFINNTIINPSYYAFQLHDEYNSTFINNTILDCTTGGFRIWWGSNYNKFLGNNIKNCSGTSETSGAFFFDWYSDYNLFINNNLRDNYKAFNLPDTWYSVHYNNSFINNTLFNNNFGFYLGSSVGADIEGNNITNSSWYGIFSDYSSGNSIHNNLFNDNYIGVYLTSSNNTEIYDNYISFSSYYNVYLSQSTNNTVYHNNLFNNRTKQAYEQLGFNYWDYYQEGNYWSDYDEDIEGCIDANADGICDLPYNISGGINKDNYPFKKSNYWFNKSLLMINISEGWNLFSPMLMPKDANTNRTIALNKGWNLIGYSSTKAFNWSKAIIKNSTGAEKDTISAGTANWIQSTIYYFNETSKSYVSVTYNNMTSKRGYWVYALKENLTLIFPNVGGSLFGPAFDWIKTSVNNGSLIKSISDSESSGWLQSTLYYYDKSYKFVPGDDSNVYPWRGYWIYSNKNLTLIIQ